MTSQSSFLQRLKCVTRIFITPNYFILAIQVKYLDIKNPFLGWQCPSLKYLWMDNKMRSRLMQVQLSPMLAQHLFYRKTTTEWRLERVMQVHAPPLWTFFASKKRWQSRQRLQEWSSRLKFPKQMLKERVTCQVNWRWSDTDLLVCLHWFYGLSSISIYNTH